MAVPLLRHSEALRQLALQDPGPGPPEPPPEGESGAWEGEPWPRPNVKIAMGPLAEAVSSCFLYVPSSSVLINVDHIFDDLYNPSYTLIHT